MLLSGLAGTAAWPPGEASPVGQGDDDLRAFALTTDALGYEVRTSLLGPHAWEAGGEPRATLVARIGDSNGLDGGARDALLAHVREGGAALVADAGVNTALAETLGWRLESTRVFSGTLANGDATRVSLTWPIGDSVHPVLGRAPAPLVPLDLTSPPEAVRILSGNGTYADLDGDRRLGEDDARGPFTVGIDMPLGQGRIIYVTTAAPFLNLAAEDPASEAFLEGLLTSLLPEGGVVVLDTSGAERGGVVAAGHASTRLGVSMSSCIPCAIAAVLVTGVIAGLAVRGRGEVLRSWGAHEMHLDEVRYPQDRPTDEKEPNRWSDA